jgi:hypothetical protein
MPEDVEKYEVHQEKHYSVPELAKLWNVSKDAIRRVFADEPGVLILPKRDGKQNHCRRYATRLIPESVVRRVHLRLSTPPEPVSYQSPAKTAPKTVTPQRHIRGNSPEIQTSKEEYDCET